MYPQTTAAHSLASLEGFIGLLSLAMTSGLMFARISRPTAKIRFSNVAVVTSYEGTPTLLFRLANMRENRILDARIRLTLVQEEISLEGSRMRRFRTLSLVRDETPLFAIGWTVMHRLDSESPLYGRTVQELLRDKVEIVVTMNGLDETLTQTVHARHSFLPSEILWDHQFVDLISSDEKGMLTINYEHFDKTVSLVGAD